MRTVETRRRRPPPVAPLDGAHAAAREVILPADVKQLVRRAEAVEVKVEQGNIPLVFVDDGEGGTGDAAAAAETAGKPAGEGGLSHAEFAGVGDDGPARRLRATCSPSCSVSCSLCERCSTANAPFQPILKVQYSTPPRDAQFLFA